MAKNREPDSQFFRLTRPEYPSCPEAFQVDMLWLHLPGEKKPLGRYHPAYKVRDGYNGKWKDKFRETIPSTEVALHSWNSAFGKYIFCYDGDDNKELIGNVISQNLLGPKPLNGNTYPALPINPWTTILQTLIGLTAHDNPPNLGHLVDQLYSLGSHELSKEAASHRLIKAHYEYKPNKQWVLDSIEKGVRDYYLDHLQKIKLPALCDLVNNHARPLPRWLDQDSVPFVWFRDSWNKLCSDEWVNALPARRWSDWASCLIRTIVGCSFIWEGAFFRKLGVELLNQNDAKESARRISTQSLMLEWNQNLSVSERDVCVTIRERVAQGREVSKLLYKISKNHEKLNDDLYFNDTDGLEKWIIECRELLKKEKQNKQKLEICVDYKGKIDSTLWETIRHTLLCRGTVGENEDLYSLLFPHGTRATSVDPRTEWLVCVCSLLAEGPGKSVRLGKLENALYSLGISADRNTLVNKLEASGLCRSSHDADDAIEIFSGF